MSHLTRCLCLLTVVLVVCTLVSPVVAQDDGNPINESDNQTGTAGPGDSNWIGGGQQPENATNATNATNGTGGGGGGGGLLPSMSAPSFPSAEEWAKDLLEWLMESLREGAENLIDQLNVVLVGVPAPGEPTDPTTWFDPENGIWPGVWALYGLTSALAMIGLIIAAQLTAAMNDRKRQRQQFKRIFVSAMMIVAGPIIISTLLHLSNEAALAFAPSGEEFLSDSESIADLGLGFLLGVLLLKLEAGVLLVGVLILLGIYFLVHFLAASWSLLWMLRALPIPTMRSWGDLWLTLFGLILVMRPSQGYALRFLFEMPWGEAFPGGYVVGLLIKIVGLAVFLIGVPKVVLSKATLGAAVGLGMSALPAGAVAASTEKARNTASNARARMTGREGADTPRSSRSRSGGRSPATRSTNTQSVAGTQRANAASKSRGRTSTASKPRKRLHKTDDGYEVRDR